MNKENQSGAVDREAMINSCSGCPLQSRRKATAQTFTVFSIPIRQPVSDEILFSI
ncbi:MAG: hypothetical protein ABJB11_15040 [Ferruginibacter sp.]